MAEYIGIIEVEGIVVGRDASGGLLVYKRSGSPGKTTTIYALNENGQRGQPYYASLKEYTAKNGERVKAAVFPWLPAGNYLVFEPGFTTYGERRITIFPGHVAETTYY